MGKVTESQKLMPDQIITLTTGKADRGTRATLAFSWGCAALAMGKKVSMFLTMDGTIWAMKGTVNDVEVKGFESLETYIDQFLSLGGEILVCAPCSEYYCSSNKTQITTSMIEGAHLTGLATIVSKMSDNTNVITF